MWDKKPLPPNQSLKPPLPQESGGEIPTTGSQHSPNTLEKPRRHLVTVLTLKSLESFCLKRVRQPFCSEGFPWMSSSCPNVPLVHVGETPDSSEDTYLTVRPCQEAGAGSAGGPRSARPSCLLPRRPTPSPPLPQAWAPAGGRRSCGGGTQGPWGLGKNHSRATSAWPRPPPLLLPQRPRGHPWACAYTVGSTGGRAGGISRTPAANPNADPDHQPSAKTWRRPPLLLSL